jgi:primary-amine oxidase
MAPRFAYNVILAFKDSKWIVDVVEKLPEGTQPQITVEELLECEKIVRGDETVQRLAKEVGAFRPARELTDAV